jgi:hypothetical protein
MSLQVWLPLNGDLKNYGLDGSVKEMSITSPTFVNSNMGQCLQCNTPSA